MKFGIDKRKSQFSSLILAKHMSRSEGLEKPKTPAYDESTIQQDFEPTATPGTRRASISWETKVMTALGMERRAIR
jgi:hypothetical protein